MMGDSLQTLKCDMALYVWEAITEAVVLFFMPHSPIDLSLGLLLTFLAAALLCPWSAKVLSCFFPDFLCSKAL